MANKRNVSRQVRRANERKKKKRSAQKAKRKNQGNLSVESESHKPKERFKYIIDIATSILSFLGNLLNIARLIIKLISGT